MVHCTFVGNSACQDGGGGFFGSANLISCLFLNNHAQRYGGGVDVDDAIVQGCLFQGNSAGAGGGGLSFWGSDVNLIDCTFTGNYGYDVGGINLGDFGRTGGYLAHSSISGHVASGGTPLPKTRPMRGVYRTWM